MDVLCAAWPAVVARKSGNFEGTIPADAAFGGQKEEGFRRFFFEHPAGSSEFYSA